MASAAASVAAFSFLAPAHAADAKAGEAKAQVCAACHGPGGNSVLPANPSLAQQPAQFIATALYQFREGNRKDPQMSPMAAKLENPELNDLGAYFAAQKAAPPQHKAKAESEKAGPEMTRKFNCSQCHGPKLMGQQHIPRLAGQQYEYLRTQLKLFKGQKRSDIDGNMTAAAQALSDQDVEVLADYLAGLAPQ